jgi:hypothetical protein
MKTFFSAAAQKQPSIWLYLFTLAYESRPREYSGIAVTLASDQLDLPLEALHKAIGQKETFSARLSLFLKLAETFPAPAFVHAYGDPRRDALGVHLGVWLKRIERELTDTLDSKRLKEQVKNVGSLIGAALAFRAVLSRFMDNLPEAAAESILATLKDEESAFKSEMGKAGDSPFAEPLPVEVDTAGREVPASATAEIFDIATKRQPEVNHLIDFDGGIEPKDAG